MTSDVSVFANNSLGSEVDAPFANTLPIAIKRHQLQLKSQKGNIPPIVWRGESPDGIPGTMTINSDHTMKIDFDLKVDRPPQGGDGHITVAGQKDQIEPVLDGLLRGMKKRNQQAYSMDGELLLSLDDFLSSSRQTLIDKLDMKIEYFNQEAWSRGILKILLSFCHKILGREWTFGQTAELVRGYVMNSRESWPPDQLRGYIAGEWDRNFRLALGKTSEVRDNLVHTLGILPYNQSGEAVALISLFGGNGVPEAVVRIGTLPKAIIQALNHESNYGVLLGYQINPKTRKTNPIYFGEVDKRISRNGPSNRRSRKALAGFYDKIH